MSEVDTALREQPPDRSSRQPPIEQNPDHAASRSKVSTSRHYSWSLVSNRSITARVLIRL